LLQDASILRDVLRLEDDAGHAFIIHLACRFPELQGYVSNEGLRRRVATPSQMSSQAPSLSSDSLSSERLQQFNQNTYGQFHAGPPTSFDQVIYAVNGICWAFKASQYIVLRNESLTRDSI
jgi:hypothetical protein